MILAVSVPCAPLDGLEGWGGLGGTDVVRVEGQRHRVAGWISYDDEWVEYLLDDGSWLCVEDEGGLRFSLWHDQAENPGLFISQSVLTHGGVTYRLTERYTASWAAAGIAGLTGGGQVRVADYDSGGHGLLALEDWGDGAELSLGRRLAPDAVTRDPSDAR
jgi:hypothetical protein